MTPRESELAGALGSDDAEERRQATGALIELGDAAALPILLRALGDRDWRVRKEATIAARGFSGSELVLAALIDALESRDNVGLRNAAVEALANEGARATPVVAAAFARFGPDPRKLVVEVLGRSRDPNALETLERALADADANVREAAIEAIASLGSLRREAVVGFLLAGLEDRDAFVVMTALEGLTTLDVGVAWERLAPLLDDPTLRSAAIANAALSSSAEAPAALARCLADARGSAFSHALGALGRLAEGPIAASVGEAIAARGPELGARLVAIASDELAAPSMPDPEATPSRARSIALRLGVLAGADKAIDAALDALADDAIAPDATRALTGAGPKALGPLLRAAADPRRAPELRAALFELVATIALTAEKATQERAREVLRAAARDAHRRVASAALFALAQLGVETDLELAAELLGSDARALAQAAEVALTAIAGRYPIAARAQANELATKAESYRAAAVLLGALGRDDARVREDMTFLAHVATAGDADARRAAVEAVAEIEGPSSIQVLSFALADEEHEVRFAAARALGRMAAHETQSEVIRQVLDLVEGTGAPDLVAATVRGLGEGASARTSVAPAPSVVDALVTYAEKGASPVAMAAVDALAAALRDPGSAPRAEDALLQALFHVDLEVVRAAALKLAATDRGKQRLLASAAAQQPEVRAALDELFDGSSDDDDEKER